jgi:hypothetical protein
LVREFGVLNTDFLARLDPRLRIPESYQVNAGVERDLGRGYSVEANFSFTRGIHLWREFNANAPCFRGLSQTSPSFSRHATSRTSSIRDPDAFALQRCDCGELVRFVYGDFQHVSRSIEFGFRFR